MCKVCEAMRLRCNGAKGCFATEAADGAVLQVWQPRGCTEGVADKAVSCANGAVLQRCQLGGCTADVAATRVFTDCFRMFRSDCDIFWSDQIRSDCTRN